MVSLSSLNPLYLGAADPEGMALYSFGDLEKMNRWGSSLTRSKRFEVIFRRLVQIPGANLTFSALKESEVHVSLQHSLLPLNIGQFRVIFQWMLDVLPEVPIRPRLEASLTAWKNEITPLYFLFDEMHGSLVFKQINRHFCLSEPVYEKVSRRFERFLAEGLIHV